MKRYQFLSLLLIASLCSFFTNTARASHAAGAELIYEWVSDSTYKFYWKFYRDCDGTTEPPSQIMCYTNPCTNFSGSVTMTKILGTLPGGGINGQPISLGCPNCPTTCTFGSLPGYQEWWYETTLTLPTRCDSWLFYVALNARNASITNLTNPGGQSIYVETELNNLNAQGNSSPFFTVKPVNYLCINSPYTYNNGGVDVNGDSLAYDIIAPRTQGGQCSATPGATAIPFSSPNFNLINNPFSTNNTFTINALTGAVNFIPNISQIGVLTVRVREYRNGIKIGSVLRDVQLVVLPCNAQQPSLNIVNSTVIGGSFVGTIIQGCATQPLIFCFDLQTADTNAVLVASTNATQVVPASTLTFTGLSTDSIRGCFSWTPGVNDTGLNVITLSVKDSTCNPAECVAVQQTFTFEININPITVIQSDTSICPNDTANLEAFGGSTFTWTVLPGGSPITTLSCTSCKAPKAFPSVTTQYVVTSNLSSLCNKNIDTVTVTVAAPPTVNVGPDIITCVNDTVQLDANLVTFPGTSYVITWTPAAGLSSNTIANPLASPAVDTRYILTVVPNGLERCAARDTIDITVLQGFNVFTSDTAICLGATVNIVAAGDPRYTYLWQPVAAVSNATLLNPTITPTVVSTVTYTVTGRYPGCSDTSQSVIIEVQPVPTVTVDPDEILCYGDTVHLDGQVTPPYNQYTYTWTPGGSVSNPNIEDPVFTALATTTLGLNVRTPAGCQDNDSVTFTVVAAKFIEVSNDTALCPRDTAQLRVSETNAAIASVRWTPNLYLSDDTSLTPSVYPVVTTRYFVEGRDTNFCLDTGSVLVTIKPEAVMYLPDSVRIYPGESYQMDPRGNVLYFNWFPPYGLTADSIANPVAMPEVNTRYIVDATTEFGCAVRDSIEVFVNVDSYVDVANAFSPGSAPNSTIKVSHLGIVALKYFRIYNRWGAKVFETSDLATGWDGTLNGEPQPMGVYVYIVEATTPTGRRFYKQGNITLIR